MGWTPKRPSGGGSKATHVKWVHDKLSHEQKAIFATGVKMAQTTQGIMVLGGGGARRGSSSELIPVVIRFVEDNLIIGRECEIEHLASCKIKIASVDTADLLVLKPSTLWCSTSSIPGYGSGPAWLAQTMTYAADTSEPYAVFEDATNFPDSTTRPPVASDPEDANAFGEVAEDFLVAGSMYQLRLNKIRTVTLDGVAEQQRVAPYWRRGDIILAQEADGGVTATAGQVSASGASIDYVMIPDGRVWARV
jgi:hypothetical protein